MLGLICDPVAGLVEVPCVKRNALGSSFALVAADMALAGIESQIPVDEVVDAMYQVGSSLPTAFRETAEVNSSPGIKAAFNYAFEKLQLPLQTDKQLSTFIGPPLEVTFGHYFEQSDEVNHAIKTFRDYYGEKGVHQVYLYTGIAEALQELNDLNYSLFVTTSKHQPMANLMLTELGIISHFKKVYGSTPEYFHKADVIKACLTAFKRMKLLSLVIRSST